VIKTFKSNKKVRETFSCNLKREEIRKINRENAFLKMPSERWRKVEAADAIHCEL
jgi:hypothetical protein